MSYIVNFFIEVESLRDQADLEKVLRYNFFPFYDATLKTKLPPTLEDIEAMIKGETKK